MTIEDRVNTLTAWIADESDPLFRLQLQKERDQLQQLGGVVDVATGDIVPMPAA